MTGFGEGLSTQGASRQRLLAPRPRACRLPGSSKQQVSARSSGLGWAGSSLPGGEICRSIFCPESPHLLTKASRTKAAPLPTGDANLNAQALFSPRWSRHTLSAPCCEQSPQRPVAGPPLSPALPPGHPGPAWPTQPRPHPCPLTTEKGPLRCLALRQAPVLPPPVPWACVSPSLPRAQVSEYPSSWCPVRLPCAGATCVLPFACGHVAAPSFWLVWVSNDLLQPLLSVVWGTFVGVGLWGLMETPCNSVS